VTQETFKNEKEIRRFLLGEMTETERAAFEEKFIAEDAGLFDEIGVAEDELIESYIHGALSAAEKTKFEKNFLISQTRRRRVAFTRELFAKLAAEKAVAAKKTEAAGADSSVWNSLVNLFKMPRFAFGVGLAILLLVFGFWFLVFRNTEKSREIVKQSTPTPAVLAMPQKPEENQNSAAPTNVNPANKPEASKPPANTEANPNKNQPKEIAPKPVTATIALFAGTVRSEGKMRVLNLTKETRSANFQLNLESRDYQTYRAEIVDADGGVVYRSGKITARASQINASFPTAKLKKGDYFVKLYGVNAAGEEEAAADFQFRVNQQ
jgi:hypothetical protein